jgi:oxaloacetate decarboxylase gamma subunit
MVRPARGRLGSRQPGNLDERGTRNVSTYLQANGTGFESYRLANVSDGNAIAISITGMLIVFVALALITVFIAALPRLLTALDPYLPAVDVHHHEAAPAESLPLDEERIVAAIGTVLHHEMQRLA